MKVNQPKFIDLLHNGILKMICCAILCNINSKGKCLHPEMVCGAFNALSNSSVTSWCAQSNIVKTPANIMILRHLKRHRGTYFNDVINIALYLDNAYFCHTASINITAVISLEMSN